MFLLSFYAVAKITAMIATLCSAQIYKKYTHLTFNQQDFIVNMHVKSIHEVKQTIDLIHIFTQANAAKEFFDDNNLPKPKKDQSFQDYIDSNQESLNTFKDLIFKDIEPLLKNYTAKYASPTKTELIKAIFENQ